MKPLEEIIKENKEADKTDVNKEKHLYDLGWNTGYKFALNKLIEMKRPTKEDMKIMIKELNEKLTFDQETLIIEGDKDK